MIKIDPLFPDDTLIGARYPFHLSILDLHWPTVCFGEESVEIVHIVDAASPGECPIATPPYRFFAMLWTPRQFEVIQC